MESPSFSYIRDMSSKEFDFNLGVIKTYRLERKLGEHIKFTALINEQNDVTISYEYWVEIDGQKIPSSIGYAKTREEFEVAMEKSAIHLFSDLIGEIAPLMLAKDR